MDPNLFIFTYQWSTDVKNNDGRSIVCMQASRNLGCVAPFIASNITQAFARI